MYIDLMSNLALTFLDTQEGSVVRYKRWKQMREQIEDVLPSVYYRNVFQYAVFEDFSCQVGELLITCDVELQGYELWRHDYVAKEGADTYYSVRFSVKKIEN